MISQPELDRIDALRDSASSDVQFLLDVLSRRTANAMVERDNWSLLAIRIGKPLGCLASCFPDGNEHIVKAAENAKRLRDAVWPYIINDGNHDWWEQWGGDAWEELRKAYELQ